MADCKAWRLPKVFDITQGEIVITFADMKVIDGKVTGKAHFWDNSQELVPMIWGDVTGTFDGISFSLDIQWQGGPNGHYTGYVFGDGNIEGVTWDNNIRGERPIVNWSSSSIKFICARNNRCTQYAAIAKKQNDENIARGCGFIGAPRWDSNEENQANWCMSVDPSLPQVEDSERQRDLRDNCHPKKSASCAKACHSPSARPGIETSLPPDLFVLQPKAVHAGCFGGMMMNAAGRCACPGDSLWQGRICRVSAAKIDAVPSVGVPPSSVVPVPVTPRLPDATQVRTCPAERPNGVAPNCCPLYTVFRGGVCVRTGQTPRSDADKVQVQLCPSDRPVGAPPNCCPRDTTFDGRACVRAAPMQIPKTGGSAGSDKVQARGCPSERPVGSWPNCCPEGTSYANGRCLRKAQTQAPQQQPNVCPPDRPVGTYPNCCPPGTTYTNAGCAGGGYNTSREPPPRNSTKGKVEQVPRPQKIPPIDITPRQQCPSYQIGAWPNCRCPKGLMGPKCDQPVVN